MPKNKRRSPITDLLRETVADSKVPLLVLQTATGVKRASLMRFLRGDQSLRLDKADALAEYFDLELVRRKATSQRKANHGKRIQAGRDAADSV